MRMREITGPDLYSTQPRNRLMPRAAAAANLAGTRSHVGLESRIKLADSQALVAMLA